MLTTTASSSKFNAIPVVAILGGGYAGVAVAQNLDKALGDKIEIILITKNDKFFHNIGSPRVLVEPEFAEQLFTSYDNMFKHKEKRSVVQAGISQLNANQVTLDNGQTIKFDYCCIATGSVYADPFKPASNSSAESIDHMKQVHEKLKSAKSFLIVGGGIVGLETAGELKTDFPDAQVTLIHSGPKIMHQMHGLGDKLRNTITQKLEAMGVKIVLNERISPPTTFQGGLELEPQVLQGATSGTSYSADVVLMTVGNSKYNSEFMHGFIEENKLSEGDVLTDEKCIKVQPTGQLEAAAFPHMFALGDVSTMDQLKMGYITAAQAETVGSNIKALINRSSKPLSVYKLDMNAGIVSLGRNHGAAQLPFGTFGSFTARMIKSKGMYAAKYRQILGSPA